MRRTIVGVMGGSVATPAVEARARELGRRIAENGWVLLSGGRPTGVMAAATAGAHEAGGLTVGVLFDTDRDGAAPGTDIVIPTGLGAGRNVVNVLASDVVVACPGSGGTLSEIALALRFERPVVLLDFDPGAKFLQAAGPGPWRRVATAADAIAGVQRFLKELGRR